MSQKTLEQIREEINAVDDSLAKILVERAALAKQVRDFKKATDTQVYHPSRERSILDRVFSICKESGFSQDQVDKVFLSVISACRSIVGDLEIAIPSGHGGLLHAAVIKQFGPVENVLTVDSVEEAFRRVQSGQSPYGIVPASVDREGIFNNTLFSMLASELSITAEISVNPTLSLCGKVLDSKMQQELYIPEDILPLLDYQKLKLIAEFPKIISISQEKGISLSEIGNSAAIILPETLTQVYPLSVVKENLSLLKYESLRYFVIGRPESNTINHNVMAFICVVKDKSGALRTLLEPFEKSNITLFAIESRTSQQSSWESVFYIECECKDALETRKAILKDLEKVCLHVKNLGSFYREDENRV